MLSDVDKAMQKLDPRTAGILNLRFAADLPLSEIATEWQISPQRVEQIVNKGLRDISEYLGGASPY
jgi:RNA polymerase sigma factor (sigma-70 family)